MPTDPSKLVQELEEEAKDIIEETYELRRKFWETTLSEEKLKPYVEGSIWAELEAAIFMAKALAASAKELTLRGYFDILESLAKQIWDECRHTRYYVRFLESLEGKLEGYNPIPGLQRAYAYAFDAAERGDLLSLHASNMLIGEAQTLSAVRGVRAACEATGRYPDLVRIAKIIERDEVFHVNNGRRVIKRYATTDELQQKAKEAARLYIEAKKAYIRSR